MKRTLLTALAVTFTASTLAAGAAVANDALPLQQAHSSWFLDAGVGGAFSNAGGLDFTNPLGLVATSNATSGNRILLNDIQSSASSVGASIGVGYMVNSNFYGKLGYRYLGTHDYTGWAAFPPGGRFNQDLSVGAHGVFVGGGFIHDLNDKVYVDASAEIGAAFLNATATQGKNLRPNNPGVFPAHTQTNFAAGVALGVGFRLNENLDFTLTGSYHYLGSAKTGSTSNVPLMRDGEFLEARDIGVAAITAGLRLKF